MKMDEVKLFRRDLFFLEKLKEKEARKDPNHPKIKTINEQILLLKDALDIIYMKHYSSYSMRFI
ncbi:hypothetical protein [Alkalihalobacillus pseudalcaliphilus]|uniref:hypothetical protein n=1 Tax=Alkalihalobacillus pseudalcaliphilus TaxID=79884 RepID=UPI00064D8CFE|nr:hypothetical protein [Alkalihalobacillus pseudalcaliphilus]KMK75812.1 hypothetical protein AB990_11125 [Alkalihalobacillus pseudalcaliphilus]